MTGPTGDWHYPRRRHLRICREDEWGVCPAEPDWHCVPVWGDGFKLEAEQTYFFPETSFGGFRRTVLIPQRQDATGRLETCLWPELAEFLLDMALERTSGQLASYCFDYFTPADPRRVRGVMVERVALHTEGGQLRLRFELMGAAGRRGPTRAWRKRISATPALAWRRCGFRTPPSPLRKRRPTTSSNLPSRRTTTLPRGRTGAESAPTSPRDAAP